MRFIAITIFVLSYLGAAIGQQDMMLYNSPVLWHKNNANPAFYPESKFLFIGLPALTVDAAHSGDVSFGDAIVDVNGKKVFNFSTLLDKLDDRNEVYVDNRIQTLSVGFKLPAGFRMSFGHAVRTHLEMEYPKALPQILWQGNAQFVGQTVQIGPQMNLQSFNELGLSLAKKAGPLTVGGRLKILTGLGSVKTNKNVASVYTNPDIYQLSLTTDYDFYSSSFIDVIDTSGNGFDLQTGEVDFRLFGANGGTAFDFGATFQVNEQIELSASVLDLGGKIKWTGNAKRFQSKGTFDYDGAVIPGKDFIDGSSNLSVDSQLDSLNDIFQFQQSDNKEFETKLPTRFFISGSYKLTDKWRFGATAYVQDGDYHRETQVGINARWSPLRWLALSTMFSLNRESNTNLGFGVSLTPGPVQVYAMSDHIINAFSATASGDVNFRIGMALAFGSPKEKIANVVEEVVD